MALRFAVLASGSGGNASLLDADGFGVLIDAGIGPRLLASHLHAIGATWEAIRVVLLTHTHSDHWKRTTFTQLLHRRINLYCHPAHHAALEAYCFAFPRLRDQGLVRAYEPGREFALGGTLRVRPFQLQHDANATFGFRFDKTLACGTPAALAYVADLGCWGQNLVPHLLDVDLLALEFNHDVAMEKRSGRPSALVARVLGDHGHLSNVQAAELLREVKRQSMPGRLRHVVQLHLSRDCNCPNLAAKAARAVLNGSHDQVAIHTARQERPGPFLNVGGDTQVSSRRSAFGIRQRWTAVSTQPMLPGWEDF
jgi:phosphoribosyl 1,2-cyclic phosphodiesterase